MTNAREAILAGAKAARKLQLDLGIEEQVRRGGFARIDVFSAINKLGATLMFQPLDKLLGAYVADVEPGVLITTERPLPVQRFTGAHELGHFFMGHEPSFDDEKILRRAPFAASGRHNRQEREADAFASMFLAPAWLLALNLERQSWLARDLESPIKVYQLSLRIGTSYSATCYALERHKAIGKGVAQSLLDVEPKTLKQHLAAGYEPPNWRSDVWLLTEKDEGTLIEGGRKDMFVVRLRENSDAGYLWDFDQLKKAGFALVADQSEADDRETIGGKLTRRVTAQSEDRNSGEILLQQFRPWKPDSPMEQLLLRYDLRGPEQSGFWEPELKRLLQAA